MQNHQSSEQVSPSNLFSLLWVGLSICPWILPNHTAPWPGFYSEWLWAVLLAALVIWAACASRQAWSVRPPDIFLVAVAAIPLLQAASGVFLFPAESSLYAAYLLLFAAAMGVGRHMHGATGHQIIDWLLSGIAIAAVISTGLALYQWWALQGLGLMVPAMEVGGGRTIANMGQSNNLSTLMVWGLVAIWWGYHRSRLGGLTAFLCAAFLLLGVATTGSRTGWLQVTVLGVFAAFLGLRQISRLRVIWLAALFAWFAALVVTLPLLSHSLWGANARTAAEIAALGLRYQFWEMAFKAIWLHPAWGFGWNQTILAHVALAQDFPRLTEAMGHAHNLALDLLLWNGVPLGLLLLGALVWWLVKCARHAKTEAHCILLCFLLVFLLHAGLEMPYIYTYYLVPVGIVAGVMGATFPGSPVLSIPRGALAILGIAASLVLVAMFEDYLKIEDYLKNKNMVAARITGAVSASPPQVYVLKPLLSALETINTDAVGNMADTDLENLRKAALRYPTSGAPFRYVKAAAMNGRLEDAGRVLDTLCNMYPKEKCEIAKQELASVVR